MAVICAPFTEVIARHGPYDAIILEGAAEELPAGLIDQLKPGGRIVAIFADGNLGTVRLGQKAGTHVDWRMVFHAGAPVLPGFAREHGFVL